MKLKVIGLHSRSIVILMALLGCPALATEQYEPKIPVGYYSQAVLHVAYGKTAETVGVEWGGGTAQDSGDGEYTEPSSVTNMRVEGSRFYFIDATVDRIKQFRSPGNLVWQTKPFPNLAYYAIARDGSVFLVWGTGLNKLSRLDGAGELIWTQDDALSRARLKELGLSEVLPGLGWIEWTPLGLSVRVHGRTEAGSAMRDYVVLVDLDGHASAVLPGQFIATDGSVYDRKSESEVQKALTSRVTIRDKAGHVVREISPEFGASGGVHTVGICGVSRLLADSAGGFLVNSPARLPSRLTLTSKLETSLEDALWRFDDHGNFREQWRFPSSKFAARASQIVVGTDGNVYHLQFGEAGVDVVKYARTAR